VKRRSIVQLRRLEGQVRELQKMVEEDRYCAHIMMQISSVQEALRSVRRTPICNHLRHCAVQAISHGSPEEAEAMYDELLALIYKHSR
jgi:DNA-binding FrmR family transcriptional regulator